MADDVAIKVGDRVAQLQIPGVFTVVARRGPFLELMGERAAVRMTVHEVQVRRLDAVPAVSKDA
jgi:hypothetical protein